METSSCIVEGLYLGGILAALNENDLAEKGITHVLSVDENPLPKSLKKKFTCKHIQALDVSECDLLHFFPDTFVFIEQARNVDGHVLVHCQAGVSRSVTVVCAYLMQKLSTTKDKALELITASRPGVRPNSGFMEQLDLFEAMGCQLIKTHPLYRSLQLRKLADRFQSGHYATGSQDMEVLSDLLLETDFSSGGNDAYYKCRKCRVILFRHGAVTTHKTGKGESAFDWRGVGPSKHSSQALVEDQQPQGLCQRSLFVDPLLWMKGKINETCGKLHCPKCDTKIGSYVWYGEKCPCGSWVAPAFHIDSGKVDRIPFQTVAPSSRMPRGATNVVAPSSRDGVVTPLSSSSLPERSRSSRDPAPPMTLGGNSCHNLPPSSNNRSLSAKSNTTMVAAVAPLVSSSPSSSSLSEGSRRVVSDSSSSRLMEVEGDEAAGVSSFPPISSGSRQRVIGQAAPLFNTSASRTHGDGINNAMMDVDS